MLADRLTSDLFRDTHYFPEMEGAGIWRRPFYGPLASARHNAIVGSQKGDCEEKLVGAKEMPLHFI